MAMGVIIAIAAGVLIAIVMAFGAMRRSQRRRDMPELNQHPERLDQTLDNTDDA